MLFKRVLAKLNVASSIRLLSNQQLLDPLQEAALSERCIVVDENDKRIASTSKLDCHKIKENGELTLHRAFSVFLFNSKGDILLQKRAASKITFPSQVTNACCSHPIEDFPEELIEENALGVKHAAKRRLSYELGIPANEIDVTDFQYLTRIHYKSQGDGVWGEHEMDYVLFLHKDVSLHPNMNEVSMVEYIKREDFKSYLETLKDPLTPWFRLIANSRLLLWWDNLANLQKFEDHDNIERFHE